MPHSPAASLLVLALLAGALPPQDSGAPNPVLTRVGEVEITFQDLHREVNRLIPLQFFHSRVPREKQSEFTRQAMDSLIEKALVFQDARARGLEPSEKDVRERFKETLRAAGRQYDGISRAEQERLLESYRPLVVRRILLDRNEARFEASLPRVPEEAVRRLFDELAGRLSSPEEVRFRHILLKVPASASAAEAEELRQRMVALRERLAAGEAFADLAREASEDIFASEGGDMGFVMREDFKIKALADSAFSLADGQTSGILQSLYGFHLLRREETRPGRPLSFEEARGMLASRLAGEERRKAREAWMAELRERYPVKVLMRPEDAASALPAGAR